MTLNNSDSSVRIGIDIGGTFTDAVVAGALGDVHSWKSPSIPGRQTESVLNAVHLAAAELGLSTDELLRRAESFVVGTTVTTNAMLSRTGSNVGLLTTRGFRDHYHFARQSRAGGVDVLDAVHPLALMSLANVAEVTERTDRGGRILSEVDPDEVAASVLKLLAIGVDSIAVSLLWATANPQNEMAVLNAIDAVAPGIWRCASSQVVPIRGEYERTATTVLSAYVGPILADALRMLEAELLAAGLRVPVRIMKSDGGTSGIENVLQQPAQTVLSGPAGGVAAAGSLTVRNGLDASVTLDIGGTSGDVGLVSQGRALTTFEHRIGGHILAGSGLIDIETVGAGGGSAVRSSLTGELTVGPESVGAFPGPAAYGRGGTEFALTDAYVLLGFLSADDVLGGQVSLDVHAAEDAADRLAAELGMERLAVAQGAFEVASHTFANAIRARTVQRGLDPRSCTLIPFGGAGAMHAAAVADAIGITRIVVPALAGVFSATGLQAAAVSHVEEITCDLSIEPSGRHDINAFNRVARELDRMLEVVRARLSDQGVADEAQRVDVAAIVSYAGQQLQEQVRASEKFTETTLRDVLDAFEVRYSERFGEASLSPISNLSVKRIVVYGREQRGETATRTGGAEEVLGNERTLVRDAALGEGGAFVPTSIYDEVIPGQKINGPSILHRSTTTVVVPHGWVLTVGHEHDMTLERLSDGY